MVEVGRIEAQAEISVARGCGFAALAILTFMIGLSWDMALATEVGGLLVLLVCAILTAKAARAHRRPVRNTELWMMLEPSQRPSAAAAQHLIAGILRTCYLRFALQAAALSIALFSFSFGLRLVQTAVSP